MDPGSHLRSDFGDRTLAALTGLSFCALPVSLWGMRIRPMNCWLLLWLCSSLGLQAAGPRIIKVLPQYLDTEGRAALSPSLYERDAYQALLRQHPEKRSGLRFDINWKAKGHHGEKLVLRIELRCTGRDFSQPIVLERTVQPPRLFSKWSWLLLEGQEYQDFGRLLAWRVSLWRGKQLLAEQKSFLW